MLKKTLIITALFVSSHAMASETSAVAGGTITFNGVVSDTTCDVTTNNGADFTVNLSPITINDVGEDKGVVTSNSKDFTMSLKNCSAADDDAKTLKVNFSSSNLSDDGKYLKNYSTEGAEGVGIALTSDGSTAIDFNSAFDTGLSSADVDGEGVTLTMHANYYNYGGANITSGKIITDATYSFSYD